MAAEDYHDMFESDLYTARRTDPDFLLGVSQAEQDDKESRYNSDSLSYQKLRKLNPKAHNSLMKLKRTVMKKSIRRRKSEHFYLGAPHLFSEISNGHYGYTHASIDKAIAEAREKVNDTGVPQFVVKVVAIIEPVEVTTPTKVTLV